MGVLIGIFAALIIVVGLVTWLSSKFKKETPEGTVEKEPVEIPIDCCGAHEVCEVEEMLMNPKEIVYFEDEELDRFQGISPDRYNDTQIEEFRDVLYTLKGDEIKIWLLSIERRQVQLPNILRSEALMLIAEA